MSNLLIFNQNFFWISIFLAQVFILYLLSNSFHNKLHFLGAGISKNRLFIAKVVGYIFFIGTLVHELSHIIMARLLFVRTKNINLQTEIIDDRHIKYGTAEIEATDPFRSSIIGIAPLIFGIILIYLLTLNINFNFFSWIDAVKLFLISQISNSMFLSDSDTKDLKVVLFISFIILLCLFFIDVKPEDAIKRIQQRGTTKEVFESIEELTRIYSNFKKVLPPSTIYLDGTLSQSDLVRQCIQFINSFGSIN
jgi:hypothetical protein